MSEDNFGLFEDTDVKTAKTVNTDKQELVKTADQLLQPLEQPFSFSSLEAWIEYGKALFEGGVYKVKAGDNTEVFEFDAANGKTAIVQVAWLPTKVSQIQDQRKQSGKDEEKKAKGLAVISGTLHIASQYNGQTTNNKAFVLNGDKVFLADENGERRKVFKTIGKGHKMRVSAFSVIAPQTGDIKGTTPYSVSTLPYYNPAVGLDLLGEVQASLIQGKETSETAKDDTTDEGVE